jgi:hypothetical protein
VRHLGSVCLALVISPLVLVLAGRGMSAVRETTEAFPPDPFAAATALAALGLAGMLITLLIMPRFSPLGLLLAGLGYLVFGAWTMVDPDLFAMAEPFRLLGWDRTNVTVTGAVALLLAMPMVLSIFSVQRWRHPRNRLPADQPHPAYAAPTYPAAGYPASPYPTTGFPAAGSPAAGYQGAGYPAAGYPAAGYPATGYPATGYPATGFPATGFPAAGYSPGRPPAGSRRPVPDSTLEMPAVIDDGPATDPRPRPAARPRHPAPTSPPATDEPTVAGTPGASPPAEPAAAPSSAEPTGESTAEPTGEPTTLPTGEPTVEPTTLPTVEPTTLPTPVAQPAVAADPDHRDDGREAARSAGSEVETAAPTAEPGPVRGPASS